MARRKIVPEILFTILLFTALNIQPVTAQISDRELGRPEAHWESISNFESMDHRILTVMEFGDVLIVGGEFNGAQGVVLNHIASWDGSHWSPLGDGLNLAVRCLGTYQGQIIAGGDFTESGGRAISHVARWNGQEWEAMGEGFDGSPTCFVEWNGRLVAGGVLNSIYQKNSSDRFSYTASWDGTQWTPMGNDVDFTALSAPPRDLIVYRGSLYAAGSFTRSSPLSQPIARWTGSEWLPMGPGMSPYGYMGGKPKATSLALLDSLLVVGGDFTKLDSLNANHLVAFDGSSWALLGQGFPGGVLDLEVHQGKLFATGFNFTPSGQRVASWDGVSWKGMNIGIPIRALASHNELLYAVGGTEEAQIEAWNGTEWLWVTRDYPQLAKFPNVIQALAMFQDHVVIPDWGWWYEPHAPMDVEEHIHHDSIGLGLHAFHGLPAWDYWSRYPTAMFQGSLITGWNTWNGVSAGRLPNPPFTYPVALTTQGDSLIAATSPNCWPATPEIWAWNGQSWSPFADGLCPVQTGETEWDVDGVIRVLSAYRKHVIVGGFFSYNDDMDQHLALWNGTSWERLGGSPNDMVTSLLEYHGDLVAAGFFDHVGGVEASHVARWDGNEWHAMGPGTDGPVFSLAIYNDRLVAGGFFKHAGGLEAGSIAAWDGKGWIDLDSGVDGEVLTMVSNQGTLWVGGEFSKAGGVTSFHLAKWVEGPRAAGFSVFSALRGANGVFIQIAASYLPFDHQGFLVYRRTQGETEQSLTPTPITSDEFSFADSSPPLGPVTYVIAGVASTGAVTRYASAEVAADPALRFALLPVRPNPSYASATITFHNAKAGPMRVAVFDLQGRLVSELLYETLSPGAHSVTWNGRDTSGRSVAAGTYFCRVTGPEGTLVERLVRRTQ